MMRPSIPLHTDSKTKERDWLDHIVKPPKMSSFTMPLQLK